MTLTQANIADEELEEKVASGLHGKVGGLIHGLLFMHIYPRKLGWVLTSSTAYNFNDGLPRREPDVSFVRLEKLPNPPDEDLNLAPDLAVEVVSKNDRTYEVDAKVQQYLAAGVRLIWVVRPVLKVVDVYRSKTGPVSQTFSLEDELDGGEVLPGFKLQVKALFE